MESRLRLALARTSAEIDAAYAVRHEVFVLEQNVPVALERDQHDPTADHLLAWVDGEVVGTIRLVEEPGGAAHLGRLVVREPARGSGVGVALVRAVEDRARQRGLSSVVLAAQTYAVGFYERLGYTAYGEVFDDAGIPHRWMRAELEQRREVAPSAWSTPAEGA
jgi:predicted GNAT family N-acyltransferase